VVVSRDGSDVADVPTEFDLLGGVITPCQSPRIWSVGTSAVEAQKPGALFPMFSAQGLKKGVLTLAVRIETRDIRHLDHIGIRIWNRVEIRQVDWIADNTRARHTSGALALGYAKVPFGDEGNALCP
jgi:hypothetical protein